MRLLIALLLLALTAAGKPARIKELVSLEGVRENQLIGYGLVVGLNGTGDKRQTFFSAQSLANMLDRMGVQINPQQMNNSALARSPPPAGIHSGVTIQSATAKPPIR